MTDGRRLGEIIRLRRTAMGLTQEALARRVGNGVRQSDISRLEKGKVALPRRERLAHIAAALEIPVGELLVRSGWIGADDALAGLASDPVAGPRPAASPPAPAPAARVTATRSAPPPSPRLADVLARSQELRTRTADLLTELTRQAEATWGPASGGAARAGEATPALPPPSRETASDAG